MKTSVLVSSGLAVVCLATLWAVWGQHRQIAELRSQQQQLSAQRAAKSAEAMGPVAAEAARVGQETAAAAASLEVLKLRSEVTRLTERRRELVSARAENERLRAEVASRGTNSAAGSQPPPGYVRQSEARMVGYGTPEDTIQSLLWAVRNHDWTNTLQAFTPERAQAIHEVTAHSGRSIADLFQDAGTLVGARILTRQRRPDGAIQTQIEVLPGLPPVEMLFLQVNGQWKMASPL
jgi:hypothetical protein